MKRWKTKRIIAGVMAVTLSVSMPTVATEVQVQESLEGEIFEEGEQNQIFNENESQDSLKIFEEALKNEISETETVSDSKSANDTEKTELSESATDESEISETGIKETSESETKTKETSESETEIKETSESETETKETFEEGGSSRYSKEISPEGYVADEVIVVFDEGISLESDSIALYGLEDTDDREDVGEDAYATIVEQFSDEDKSVFEASCVTVNEVVENSWNSFVVFKLDKDTSVKEAIAEFEQLDNVKYAQPNFVYYPETVTTNDPKIGWHFDSMEINKAWDIAKCNQSVVVAVVDTGTDCNHPDLKNLIYRPGNVTGGQPGAYYGDHGTATAGIIAAQVDNGIGIAGISYNAKVMPVCITSEKPDGGTAIYTTSIGKGIQYAMNNGAQVINISIGGMGETADDVNIYEAMDDAAKRGIACVCSAGNSSSTAYHSPSDYDTAIGVIAINENLEKDSDSNYGAAKDISAPGINIPILKAGGSMGSASGTSMAAPMVSGVIALMLSVNPNLNLDEIKEILYSTATDLGAPGKDDIFANGEVNAYRAVRATQLTNGSADNFIESLYTSILGRNPGGNELMNYYNLIANGSTGVDVAEMILFSAESKQTTWSDSQFIDKLYNSLLNRTPDTSSKNMYLDHLKVGMSRAYVFSSIANSSEFQGICNNAGIEAGSYSVSEARDKNYNVTAFVYRLYQYCLGRTPDVGGLNNWTDGLISRGLGGKAVAFGFFFSDEYASKKTSNTTYVKTLYKTLLNREADSGGLNNWVSQLNAGASRSDVFYGVGGSQEFVSLCKSYGINP